MTSTVCISIATLLTEVESSMDWLGTIAASPDSSIMAPENGDFVQSEFQQTIREEQAEEIFKVN